MRIIGGKFKGRIINPAKNFRARPTTDMAKEGLFNILSNRFDFSKINVLDLFAGSGNISFEFASRGCENIICVESDLIHHRFIKKIISDLNLKITAIHGDSFSYLEKTRMSFDVIFADPPFNLPDLESIPACVFRTNVLNMNGLFILEHSKSHNFTAFPYFIEVRAYGHILFSFFKQKRLINSDSSECS